MLLHPQTYSIISLRFHQTGMLTARALSELNIIIHKHVNLTHYQDSTLTCQITNQVANNNLDVKKISLCLPAKLASGNRKLPAQTDFPLVCGWLATVNVSPDCYLLPRPD